MNEQLYALIKESKYHLHYFLLHFEGRSQTGLELAMCLRMTLNSRSRSSCLSPSSAGIAGVHHFAQLHLQGPCLSSSPWWEVRVASLAKASLKQAIFCTYWGPSSWPGALGLRQMQAALHLVLNQQDLLVTLEISLPHSNSHPRPTEKTTNYVSVFCLDH